MIKFAKCTDIIGIIYFIHFTELSGFFNLSYLIKIIHFTEDVGRLFKIIPQNQQFHRLLRRHFSELSINIFDNKEQSRGVEEVRQNSPANRHHRFCVFLCNYTSSAGKLYNLFIIEIMSIKISLFFKRLNFYLFIFD